MPEGVFFIGSFMRKILLIVFFIFLFSIQEVSAVSYPWKTWVKFAGNPVLNDPIAQCIFPEVILSEVSDPLRTPIKYPHPTLGNKFWLYYDPCWLTGGRLAYSDDLIHWIPYENNPVISPVTGEVTLFIGNMFKDGSKYYIFYDIVGGVKYASAPTPFGPWTRGNVVLGPGVAGSWDEGRVTETFVMKDNDIYYMYYMGDTVPPYGRREQVGVATTPASKFPAGPWTKKGLILPFNLVPNTWDSGLVADPSVIKVGDIYYMNYTGSWHDGDWMIGIAWATNPLGPWNRPVSPILYPGLTGSWEDEKILRGAIHYYNGKYYLPYAGSDGYNFRGGVATAKVLLPTGTPTLSPTPTTTPSVTITPTATVTPSIILTPTPTIAVPYSFKLNPAGGQVAVNSQSVFSVNVNQNSSTLPVSRFHFVMTFSSAELSCLGVGGVDATVMGNCSNSGGYVTLDSVAGSTYPKVFAGKIGIVSFQFKSGVNKAIVKFVTGGYPNGIYVIGPNGNYLSLSLPGNYCFSTNISCN